MKKYEIISPPFTLEFKNMSDSDLKSYYHWYKDNIAKRIYILTSYVNSTPGFENWKPDYSPESLKLLGEWFSKKAKKKLLSGSLTNESFSLAIDIGMYLSEALLKNNSQLKWHHAIDVRKDDSSYGQPVIRSFKGDVDFNPVQIMVALGFAFSNKNKSGNRLYELYKIWKDLIK